MMRELESYEALYRRRKVFRPRQIHLNCAHVHEGEFSAVSWKEGLSHLVFKCSRDSVSFLFSRFLDYEQEQIQIETSLLIHISDYVAYKVSN